MRVRYTEVCTIMALLSGALLGSLTRRPAWAAFRLEKQTQRKKLAALGKKLKAEEKMRKKKAAEKREEKREEEE